MGIVAAGPTLASSIYSLSIDVDHHYMNGVCVLHDRGAELGCDLGGVPVAEASLERRKLRCGGCGSPILPLRS